MFGWLANLLVKAPIAGFGCACCEAKKEHLKQMQKAVLTGDFSADNESSTMECDCECVSYQAFEQNTQEEDMHSCFHYKL